jgi:hypothetical protein
MIEYICVRCGVSFKNNKACIRNHFYRKNECKKKYDNKSYDELIILLECDEYINYYNKLKNNIINNIQINCCEFCDSKLSNKYNLLRHLKTCKKAIIIQNQDKMNHNKNQNQQQVSNTYNIVNNNIINNYINIENINALGYEDKTLIDYDKLEFVNKEEYDNYSLNDKSNNHVHNLKSILDDIYKNPVNQNFKLVNKKEQKYKVKVNDTNIESKHIIELHNIINDIIVNIYDEYLNDNKEKLEHYIDHLQEHYKQLQKYKENKYDKTAREYKIINDKVQKCLKRAIVWIAEDNKKNNILLN